jgi:hypothetical protein
LIAVVLLLGMIELLLIDFYSKEIDDSLDVFDDILEGSVESASGEISSMITSGC